MIRAFAGLDDEGMLVLWRQDLSDTDRAAINLTRLGADGLEQWSRQQTALRADVGMLEMVAMPGGGAAVSYTLGGNAEVTRMAPDGSTVWSRSDLVGSGQGVNGLAADGEDLMVLVRHYSFDLEEPETFTLSRLGPDGTSTAPLPLELEADNFTPLVLKPDGAGGILVQGEIYKGNYESSRALIRHIGPDGQSRWGSLAYPGHYNAPAGMVNLPDGTLLTIVNVSPTAELTQFRARLVVINASGDELDEGWLEAPGRQVIVVDVLPAGDDRLVVFALIGDPDDPTRTYPWLLTLVSQEDWLDLPRFQSPVESD